MHQLNKILIITRGSKKKIRVILKYTKIVKYKAKLTWKNTEGPGKEDTTSLEQEGKLRSAHHRKGLRVGKDSSL